MPKKSSAPKRKSSAPKRKSASRKSVRVPKRKSASRKSASRKSASRKSPKRKSSAPKRKSVRLSRKSAAHSPQRKSASPQKSPQRKSAAHSPQRKSMIEKYRQVYADYLKIKYNDHHNFDHDYLRHEEPESLLEKHEEMYEIAKFASLLLFSISDDKHDREIQKIGESFKDQVERDKKYRRTADYKKDMHERRRKGWDEYFPSSDEEFLNDGWESDDEDDDY